MKMNITGSGLVSLSYVLLSGIGVSSNTADAIEVAEPQLWFSKTADLEIQSGLRQVLRTPYVMKASEEESFFKALLRSKNIVHRGTLR